jgi:hypothetical protein
MAPQEVLFMGDLDISLKAVEQALRRKKELRKLIEILLEEYKLVKVEIEMHKERIEKLMAAKEYSAYLDTIQMESFEFPIYTEEKPTDKK